MESRYYVGFGAVGLIILSGVLFYFAFNFGELDNSSILLGDNVGNFSFEGDVLKLAVIEGNSSEDGFVVLSYNGSRIFKEVKVEDSLVEVNLTEIGIFEFGLIEKIDFYIGDEALVREMVFEDLNNSEIKFENLSNSTVSFEGSSSDGSSSGVDDGAGSGVLNSAPCGPSPCCGDGECNGDEDCSSCLDDCGECNYDYGDCTINVTSLAEFDLARETAVPGDVVCLAPLDYGSVTFTAEDSVGNSTDEIVYVSIDPLKAKIQYLDFDRVERDYYLVFDGITFDPGYVDEYTAATVNLHGVHHMTFRNSHFEGSKVGISGINDSDYAPHVFAGSFLFSSGYSPALSSHIDFHGNTLSYSYRGIYITQHPSSPRGTVSDYAIYDNDFSLCGEDCITTGGVENIYIGNNTFRDQNSYQVPYCWSGLPRGDWTNRIGQKMTQEGTGASGTFYELNPDGRCRFNGISINIYADDSSNPPNRIESGNWVFDDDPSTYFILPTRYYWNGSMTGDWDSHTFENITQDVTGHKAMFTQRSTRDSFDLFFIIPNSERYPGEGFSEPSVTDNYVWRLDSDPDNIYFTPSQIMDGSVVEPQGDNAHADFIALQGATYNVVVENNFFNQSFGGAQVIKIEEPTRNVTFQKNLVSSVYTGAWPILIGGEDTKIYNNTLDIWEEGRTGVVRALFGLGNVYFEGNIVAGAQYTAGTVHSQNNIWGSEPPVEFGELTTPVDFSELFVEEGVDYRLRSGSVACVDGVVTHGHLAGQSC